MYCGQTVRWIKMTLSMQVRIGPGHIVLDGNPAAPKGHSPQLSAHICSSQMAVWIKMPLGTEVGLSLGDTVLDGDPALPPRKGTPPQFSANVRCGQMAGWTKMPLGMELARPRARRLCVRWGPSSPQKEGHSHPTQFLAHVYWGQTAGYGSRCRLVRR